MISVVHPSQDKYIEPSDKRSLPWRRAWRALTEYEWAADDDEYEEHPEEAACECVQKALNFNSLEARASEGFLAGRCLIHLAANQGAEKSATLLLESGCQVPAHAVGGDEGGGLGWLGSDVT